MKIFMIRHGQTAGNVEHRYVGRSDEVLTEAAVGELESRRCYFLRLTGVCDFDTQGKPGCYKIISSPMRRCIETAGILFPGHKCEIVDNLRECDFGEFEYRNYDELRHNADYQRFIDSGGEASFPGGETKKEFSRRCVGAFREIIQRYPDKEAMILIVHGGTIMSLLDEFSFPHSGYFDWQVKNGNGYEAELVVNDGNEIKLTNIKAVG